MGERLVFAVRLLGYIGAEWVALWGGIGIHPDHERAATEAEQARKASPT